MNGEAEQESRLLEVGCIGALCVGLTVIVAMCVTTAFPNVKVPPVLGFCGGGALAALVFGLALWAYFQRGKAQAQDEDEGAS